MSRVAEGGTAFGNRQASHAITVDGVWRPGEDFGDGDTAWTREFFAALGRFREGVYVNFLGGDEDPDRIREAYGDRSEDHTSELQSLMRLSSADYCLKKKSIIHLPTHNSPNIPYI